MSLPNAPIPKPKDGQLRDYLMDPRRLKILNELMPKHMTPERMASIAISAAQRSPALLECTPASIFLCLKSAAQLGLDAGGLLGSAYLVPFKNSKTGNYEAVLIAGYRGLIDLCRRSGEIAKIEARVVFEGEIFDIDYGAGTVTHKPQIRRIGDGPIDAPAEGDSGPVPPGFIGAYAVATFKSGHTQMEFMDAVDVDRIRRRSKAAKDGPWVTDYSEMARKTVVRRLVKYLPVSVELGGAMAIEDAAEQGRGAEGMRDVTPADPLIEGALEDAPALPQSTGETVKEMLAESEKAEPVKVAAKK